MRKRFITLIGALLLVAGIATGVWSLSLPGCNSVTCMLIGDFSSPLDTLASVAPPLLALFGFFILYYGRSLDNQFDKPKSDKGLYDGMEPEKM